MSIHPPITPGGGDEDPDLAGEVTLGDEPEPSAFESLLRQVARAPVDADAPLAPELAPGVIVADRFELMREIGRGGFARVFEARDRVLSRLVAIKLLKRRRLNDSELELFYREARATARLNHPHIVTAYDWGAWNDTPFLVLELLDGESLEKQVARGPLGEKRAWEIVTEVAQALAYAHSLGVLHLDLKLQNVFVLRDGRVKVLDFGLAGLDWDEEIPGRRVRIGGGTPRIMAPEQAEGAPTDARADVWAVGVMLHHLLFARLPETLAPEAKGLSLPAGTSRRVEQLLARTLSRDPEERYPDAAALVAALTEAAGPSDAGQRADGAALTETTRGLSPVRKSRSWLSSRAGQRFAASLSAIVVAAAAVVLWRLEKSDYFWRDPLANAHQFQRLTEFEGAEHSAAISRDGEWVAFLSSHEGPVSVWVTRIGSGRFTNLTANRVPEQLVNREIRLLEFSPDGALVYFWVGRSDTSTRREIGLWAVPRLGGAARVYRENVAELAWSPDRRHLAYHTPGVGDPMFVESEGGGPRQIHVAGTPSAPKHAHFQTWSPDQSFIYFVEGEVPDGPQDIWRIGPAGGSPERITFHNSRLSYPTFLDSSTLLYLATSADGKGPWIYGIDVDRRVPHRISRGVERYTSLAVSGDRRRLVATAATQFRTSLWRVPLSAHPAQASEASKISLPTAQGRSPMLAAKSLLYVSSDGASERIWKLLADGTATDLWPTAAGRIIGGPAIAPEEGRIAFSIEDRGKTRLVVMNADGTGVRTLADSLELRGAPAWSPDGHWIVTAVNETGRPHLFRISLDTGEAVRLLDDYALDPAWAPRGEFVVYSSRDPGTEFPVKAVTAAGEPYPIPELTLSRSGGLGVTRVGARRLRFMPGRAELVVLRGDIEHKNLWAFDLTAGTWRQLTKFGRDIVIGDFDVSKDGREIVFERIEESSDVWVMDLTTR